RAGSWPRSCRVWSDGPAPSRGSFGVTTSRWVGRHRGTRTRTRAPSRSYRCRSSRWPLCVTWAQPSAAAASRPKRPRAICPDSPTGASGCWASIRSTARGSTATARAIAIRSCSTRERPRPFATQWCTCRRRARKGLGSRCAATASCSARMITPAPLAQCLTRCRLWPSINHETAVASSSADFAAATPSARRPARRLSRGVARRAGQHVQASGNRRVRHRPPGGHDPRRRGARLEHRPLLQLRVEVASGLVGSPQLGDVDLFHLQHRRHDPLRLLGVFVLQHLAQDRGNHLPRQAEFVLEPPALDFLAAGGELLPEMVHFLLALAVDDEGYRLAELEHTPAVQRDEILARALESHR